MSDICPPILGAGAEGVLGLLEALWALLPFLRACEQSGQPPDAALVQAVRQALG